MNDQLKTTLLGIVRHGVTAGGTMLASYGVTLSDGQGEIIAGAVVILLSMLWSSFEKKWQARNARTAEVAAAIASADRAIPVTVTETPMGLPNIAVPISVTEQALAPAAPMTTAELNQAEISRHAVED